MSLGTTGPGFPHHALTHEKMALYRLSDDWLDGKVATEYSLTYPVVI
jgi:hypothetical protein